MNEFGQDDMQTDRREEALQRLLKFAGPRREPPAAMTERIYGAALDTWEQTTRARVRARRIGFAALAATVLLGIAVTWRLALTPELVPAAAAARIDRIVGAVDLRRDAPGQDWQRLTAPGATLHPGDEIRTGAAGRLALRTAEGFSVRLDHVSSIQLLAATHIELTRGRLYADSGAYAGDGPGITIDTPLGVARDIGTQFELRLAGEQLSVRVREGRVALAHPGGRADITAGVQLLVNAGGVATRSEFSAQDAAWRWAEEVAPAFDTDGRTLLDYLRWVARETGRELEFSSNAAASAAAATILRGSVPGTLAPSDSLSPVLATTRFHHTLRGQALVVSLEDAP